jgi:hypothetical protein
MSESQKRSRVRGRLYAACFVLGAIPFVQPLLDVPASGSTVTVAVGLLAVGVLVVGLYGMIAPDRLGFSTERETLVALAAVGVSLLYLVVVF